MIKIQLVKTGIYKDYFATEEGDEENGSLLYHLIGHYDFPDFQYKQVEFLAKAHGWELEVVGEE